MYDGYHFRQNTVGMYNPFSVLNTFDSEEFKKYWFETGTPSFLVELMRQTDYDVTGLASEQADSTLLTDIDTAFHNPIPLLYQSGYLTIKDYNKATGIYTEGTTSEDRIDILAHAPRFVYIIELKINDTVEAALQQIDQKGYARRFADDPRPLFKIGVRFSTENRCIDDWKIAE